MGELNETEELLAHATAHLVELVSHFQEIKLDKHHREIVISAKRFLVEELGHDDSDNECSEQTMH